MKHEVVFQPSGKRAQVEGKKTILEAARELGISLRSDCGGKGTCGKCRVMVTEGELSSPGDKEKRLLGDQFASGCRLACCAAIEGPLSVTVPRESLADEPIILAEGEGVPFELSPLISKYHVYLEAPSLDEPSGDAQRLLKALGVVYGLTTLDVDYPLLQKLPGILRGAEWDVTVTVWDGREIIDVEPGYAQDSYGMAVDIGTTTLVGYVINLCTGELVATESMLNPQVDYGADVMSRIVYSTKDEGSRRRIRETIVSGLNSIVAKACAKAGIAPLGVAEMTIVGNTAMHHLFLGLNAEFLAKVPFVPALQKPCDFKARDLMLEINPCANVHLLPIEAGFVGADNVGVLLATQPQQYPGLTLVIDIGTNGEIVLGSKEVGLTSCSTAAGPAFEGAHVKCGMMAAAGAIDRVRIEPGTHRLSYRTISGARPRGICGSGIIDAVAQMVRCGVLSAEGRINGDAACVRSGEHGLELLLEQADKTATGRDIVITQKDIREVQLAKAAIYTGARILMKRLGAEKVDRVILAGAFGSYVDPESAMVIGLLPQCDLGNVKAVGNAAGYGARMALLSKAMRAEAARIARAVKYVELTTDPDFETMFIASTRFT
ncbi:MAG: DUF4445 domain-containing protein [Dehalococcoidia bacterium]|nr:DUF4445 domain-containing protein [Dehalococcoidia bacterium]